MEARLYAEDPAKGFLPSVGRLEDFFVDSERLEAGVEQGDTVSPFYDPMIAKLVVHGDDRNRVRKALANACASVQCWPVKTNAWFLKRILESEEFSSAIMATNTIERDLERLISLPELPIWELEKGAINAIYNFAPTNTQFTMFDGLRGFRLNGARENQVRILADGTPQAVAYPEGREAALMWQGARTHSSRGSATIWFHDGHSFVTEPWRIDGGQDGAGGTGAILSPMPGKIIAVDVATGDVVAKGQKLLTLEAMKMEHTLTAPFDGLVAELNAAPGAQVQVEALLARIAPAPD